MQLQASANQSGGDAVEDAAHFNSAATTHPSREDLIVRDPHLGQRLQRRLLLLKSALTLAIESLNRLVNQRLVLSNTGEVSAAAQINRLFNPVLKMTMRRLDRVE